MPSMNLLIPQKYATFTLAQLQDVDAIKTAIATSTSAQVYSGVALNGAAASGGTATARLPQAFCAKLSSAAGQYVTEAIVATGTDENGAAATASVTPTTTDGNETIISTAGLVTATSIAVPAQTGTGGQFEFGFSDLVFGASWPCVQVMIGADGNIVVTFEDETAETITTLESQKLEGIIRRITRASTTVDPLTAFVARSHA